MTKWIIKIYKITIMIRIIIVTIIIIIIFKIR